MTPETQVFVSVSKHSTDLKILLYCVVAPPIMYIKDPTEAVPALASYYHVRTMFPNILFLVVYIYTRYTADNRIMVDK